MVHPVHGDDSDGYSCAVPLNFASLPPSLPAESPSVRLRTAFDPEYDWVANNDNGGVGNNKQPSVMDSSISVSIGRFAEDAGLMHVFAAYKIGANQTF
jgi:hypothetical protein